MNPKSETVTASEMARQLAGEFTNTLFENGTAINKFDGIKCAKVAVHKIIFALKELEWDCDGDFDIDNHIKFWNEVGLEIEKL